MLAGKLDVRVANPVMPRKRICSTERLLLGTHVTPDLLLASIVNRVFMSREVVGPGKDGIARLAGAGIDPFALVRSRLTVEHAIGDCRRPYAIEGVGLSVPFALVLLQQRRRLESSSAAVIRARIRTPIRGSPGRPLHRHVGSI